MSQPDHDGDGDAAAAAEALVADILTRFFDDLDWNERKKKCVICIDRSESLSGL